MFGAGSAKKVRRAGKLRRPESAEQTKKSEKLALPITPESDPLYDTFAVMKQYELPFKFSRTVLKEAEAVAKKPPKEPGDKPRLDLRKKFIFTCDPVTARDYDDALSIETDAQGRRVLGVHIADVAHYVRPGSALDAEAYRRSTSVYLVEKVVPMLPEVLSNGVCSLVPGEDRLAFSVFITFDAAGRPVARSFAKSIIRSKARYTYEQVMAVLRAGKKGTVEGVTRPAAQVLRAISTLAQELRANRFAAGALDMNVPEVEVLLDENDEMTGLEPREYDESHQMVEECMVAANEAVAKELWTRGIRILARLHEAPDPEKIEELRAALKPLGLSCGDISQPAALAKFLRKIKGHPLEGTLAVMVLRSMKRAVYDAAAIGHFGLAKKHYAHFTSPIRRYPDLTLHRQLAAYLISPAKAKQDPAYLARTAAHCTECEQRADEAERALVEAKKFRYLCAHGGEYDAVISRVANFGFFVDVPALALGGMVHVSHLSNRFVRYDEANGLLTDGRTSWALGDKIRVRVISVDFEKRWVDFAPAP